MLTSKMAIRIIRGDLCGVITSLDTYVTDIGNAVLGGSAKLLLRMIAALTFSVQILLSGNVCCCIAHFNINGFLAISWLWIHLICVIPSRIKRIKIVMDTSEIKEEENVNIEESLSIANLNGLRKVIKFKKASWNFRKSYKPIRKYNCIIFVNYSSCTCVSS